MPKPCGDFSIVSPLAPEVQTLIDFNSLDTSNRFPDSVSVFWRLLRHGKVLHQVLSKWVVKITASIVVKFAPGLDISEYQTSLQDIKRLGPSQLPISSPSSVSYYLRSIPLHLLFFFIMAAAVAGYSHNHFQSLPNLNSARDNFLKLNGNKLVEDVFKDFFITNGMDRIFGLAMPHRHFDILPGQIIVNYNGTSTAWNATPSEGMDEPQPAI
jgi:hypothetical protein